MKLALIGYGKMGRMVEQLAPEFGFETALKLDVDANASAQALTADRFCGIDAAIEFTSPEAATANLVALAPLKVPVVCGTTGWFQDLDRVRAAFLASGSALVYSANFSIGVQVFSRLAAEAARLLAGERDYAAWAWEIHHSAKKDAPSGTLLKLVDAMRAAGYSRPIDASSNRAGAHPGTHEIGFDSVADTITLRHVARSREGFARGALKAAQWVVGRQGVWEFGEVLFGR